MGKKSFQLNMLALPFNLTQGQQTTAAPGPSQAAACFGASEEMSIAFSVLNGWEKVKTRATICYTWKLYGLRMSVSIITFHLPQTHSLVYILPTAALAFHVEELLSWDKNHLTRERKIFTAWPSTGKMCQPLTWGQSGTLPALVEDISFSVTSSMKLRKYQLLLLWTSSLAPPTGKWILPIEWLY